MQNSIAPVDAALMQSCPRIPRRGTPRFIHKPESKRKMNNQKLRFSDSPGGGPGGLGGLGEASRAIGFSSKRRLRPLQAVMVPETARGRIGKPQALIAHFSF